MRTVLFLNLKRGTRCYFSFFFALLSTTLEGGEKHVEEKGGHLGVMIGVLLLRKQRPPAASSFSQRVIMQANDYRPDVYSFFSLFLSGGGDKKKGKDPRPPQLFIIF